MPQVKLLAFAGSTRTASFNKQLVKIAADGAREAGAEVLCVDLRDFPMPVFDGDLEAAEGLPANAKKLKGLFREHDGFLISSPEYNSSITAVLKNSLDWVSRPESDDEPGLIAFRGKTAAIMSASPGGLGGLRGLVHLRSILSNIGVYLIPDQVAVSSAYDAFADGKLKDAGKQTQVQALGKTLAAFTAKLKGA
jgi:NAD(P)H-dependent FMN reductase